MTAPETDLVCPISLEVFNDPVTAADGFTYNRADIERWFATSRDKALLSPMTGKPLANAKLVPNAALKARVDKWRTQHSKFYRLHNTRPELETLNSSIFEDLDKFNTHEMLQQLNCRPVTIVVMGMESHGKSTLLERMTGFPILPRGDSTCTRMIIRVKLRRGPALLASCATHDRANNGAVVPGTRVNVALEKLCASVATQMTKCVQVAGSTYVQDRELRVEIQVPYAPSLDLVDLPGFVSSGGSEATETMAESVIAEEKDHSLFLFVNQGTSAPNLSVAAKMIEKHGLHDKTLGVFTFLDMVQDPKGKKVYRGTAVARLLDPMAEHRKWAKHGWVAIASRDDPSDLEHVNGSLEVARLHLVNDDEQALVKAICDEANDKTGAPTLPVELRGLMGIGVARQRMQRLFEDYIEQRWVPSISQHLRAKFAQTDDENDRLGMPIPNDEAYDGPLEIITELAATVLPSFPCAKLQTKGNETFKPILVTRVSTISSHPQRDWLQLATIAEVWNGMRRITTFVEQKAVEWRTACSANMNDKKSYLAAQAEADATCRGLQCHATDLAKALAALGETKLANLLIDAVFTEPVNDVSLVKRAQGAWKSFFDTSYKNLCNEEQDKVAQLGRVSGLKDSYRKYAQQCFKSNTQKFKVEAEGLIETYSSAAQLMYHCATPPKADIKWRPQADVEGLGDALLQLWFRTVVGKVVEQTTAWKGTPSLQEKNKAKRIATLVEMARVCEVLDALHKLELRVQEGRQAA